MAMEEIICKFGKDQILLTWLCWQAKCYLRAGEARLNLIFMVIALFPSTI